MSHRPRTRPIRRDPCGGPRGSTLAEVIAATVLVVALVGLTLPNIDTARFRLDGEGQSLALLIGSAQRLAELRQYDIVLAFDTPRNRIRLHHDVDNDGVVDDGEPTSFLRLEDDVVFGLGGATALVPGPAPVTFGQRQDGLPSLTLRRGGRVSEDGAVYLTSLQAARTAGHSRHTRALAVETTGRVTCMSYRTSTWQEGC